MYRYEKPMPMSFVLSKQITSSELVLKNIDTLILHEHKARMEFLIDDSYILIGRGGTIGVYEGGDGILRYKVYGTFGDFSEEVATMKALLYLGFLIIVVDGFGGHPYNGYNRFPQRTVMYGGWYNNPSNSRSYLPPGAVSFAAGDTIATNSFVEDRPFVDIQSSAEETTEGHRSIEDDHRAEASSPKPRRNPKPEEDGEEEEEAPSSWPFGGSRSGQPSYNAFFPIMLGGSSGYGRKSGGGSNGEGYYPGAATAIANSFSTGKGGVATSHATSFGDPNLSTLFRDGNFNKKSSRHIKK